MHFQRELFIMNRTLALWKLCCINKEYLNHRGHREKIFFILCDRCVLCDELILLLDRGIIALDLILPLLKNTL